MSNDEFLINMGNRISQRRKALHMTQEQLADKVGVSLQTISCIELGKKAVRPENLANLCIHLDVSADYVLYGKRSEHQMSVLMEKLSALTPDEYQAIRNIVDLFHNKK